MGIYGQDWASYQGSAPSTSGIDFFFTKVTEGMGYINPYWKAQYSHGKAAGLAAGKYHYPHMGNSVQNEAGYFIANANIQPGDMIVLDWEGYDPSNQNVAKSTQAAYKDAWLKYVKGLFPHNPVGVYCNTDYWLNVDHTGYYGDFLWIATAGVPAGQPGIKAPWKFHQYSAATVDHDYGNFASKAELVAWINSFNPTQTPPPVEDDLPYTEAQLTKIVQDAVMSQPVRDELAFANIYWLDAVFSDKPLVSTNAQMQTVVNTLQTELKAALGQIDPAVLTQLQAAIQKAIASTAITATVNVNGKAV